MIGIKAIGRYFPELYKNNIERKDEFKVGEDFINQKIGVRGFYQKREDQETSDLCVEAFRDLEKNECVDLREIECVVVCTQNPDAQGLPHTSAIVHKKLGLQKKCAVFDVSLGCSGYVYGLKMIKGFMQEMGFKKGVLFTSDPYSKIIDAKDKNTALLFGDAAAATYLTDDPVWNILDGVLGSDGSKSESIRVDSESKKFVMNGRGVFNFVATTMPENISAAVLKNNMKLADVDLFLLHQGSKYMVETVASRLSVESDRVPFMAGEYGNTVSSSIPMMLTEVNDKVDVLLISGFGVGLSWGSLILQRSKEI